MSISPGDRRIAIQLAVVAIPSRCTIVGLRCVVVALAVAAEPEQSVLNIGSSIFVQVGEVVSKELPLCELAGRWLRAG